VTADIQINRAGDDLEGCVYTHPTEERKIGALDLPWLGTNRAQGDEAADDDSSTASEIAELLKDFGGPREARTRDLRVANAALSQLS
jgi:hypothetical protein